MLNTPICLNEGAIIYNNFKRKFFKNDLFLLNLLGELYYIKDEKFFNILTVVVGSGPAFFYFLIEALEMGAPPHGGIAFGLDRITMLIIGADSIRETIAFPKNQQAKCLLTNAPSNVSESQLKELDIEITIDE